MSTDEISKLIQELNLRVKKDFQKLTIEQLSKELRESMEFEQQTFQKIEEYKKNGKGQDLANYAEMICKNNTERQVSDIQEVYFEKILNRSFYDEKYE